MHQRSMEIGEIDVRVCGKDLESLSGSGKLTAPEFIYSFFTSLKAVNEMLLIRRTLNGYLVRRLHVLYYG